MPDYASQVNPSDRWAITAYIRALQLSQNATQADVPAGAHVASLKDIAESEGMPASFSQEPGLPATAVTGTPNGKLFVLPTPGAGPSPSAPAAVKSQTPGATPKQ
jgi:hypothetical protein